MLALNFSVFVSDCQHSDGTNAAESSGLSLKLA